jgi:glycosyltransferase involved in cell wall biosynthesis
MGRKLILITNIISPYRIPVFNHLAKNSSIDFKVIFLAENERHRKWRIYHGEIAFAYSILKNFDVSIRSKEMQIYLNWGLWRGLRKFSPDALCVLGYHYLATIEALIYAKLKNIPITLWAGSHFGSGFVKNPLTDLYKRAIIPRFDSYVTYGTAAKEQIVHYGAKPEKILVGHNTVDVKWFMKKCRDISTSEIWAMQSRYPSKNILYVGDLIERKGVINLIKAFEKLNMDEVGVILVGQGKQKDNYLKYIRERNLRNVFFEGFIQKEDIVKYYSFADVFVLPSLNEVWGLVVNEAMACGLPVVCSKLAGVTRDLIMDGVNGYCFDPENVDELMEKLKMILKSDQVRDKMGANSLKIIRDKTPRNYAEKILETVGYGLQEDL